MAAKTVTRYKHEKPGDPLNDEAHARVVWVELQFQRFAEYWREEIARAQRNARSWWGVNFGQWPEQVVQRLLDQGRRPPTYNVTFDKVETLLGSIMGSGFSTKYEPVMGKIDTAVQKANYMKMTDERRHDWAFVETMTFLDALIMVGYKRMMISDKYFTEGTLGWEWLNPRRVYRDPRWMSLDPDDLNCYFYHYWMTPGEIADLSGAETSETLAELRRREEVDGIDYGHYEGFTSFTDPGSKWEGRHLVMEYHYVRREKVWWEYDKVNRCLFPETGYKPGSEEDRQIKLAYAQQAGLGQDDIGWEKKNRVVKFIERVAPTINRELFLGRGKDRVQCGSCNLLPLSWRYENQDQGIVDRLYDIQQSINKNEMSMDSIITSSAKGAFFLDKALAGGDPEMMAQIEDAWNDDAARIWVDEGITADLGPSGGVVPVPRSPVTPDHFNVVDRRYNLADRFSKVPAAQESRTERSGEPNVLFENKVAIANLGQWMYSELHRRDCVKMAEWYIRQAKITYAGSTREFAGEGGEPFKVNRPGYTSDGRLTTLDDVSLLPEMMVVAIPNRNSPTARLETQSTAAQLLPIVNQDPNNRLLSLCLTGIIIEASPLAEEQKDESMKALRLLKMQAASQIATSVLGAKQALAVAENEARQITAPGQPQQVPMGPMGDRGKPIQQQFRLGRPSEGQAVAGTPREELAA